jgi:hypothetical protein
MDAYFKMSGISPLFGALNVPGLPFVSDLLTFVVAGVSKFPFRFPLLPLTAVLRGCLFGVISSSLGNLISS